MFTLNGPCFLLVPNDQNHRLLVPGKVWEILDGQIIAQFDDCIAINPGDNAIVLAEWKQKFFQQSVTISRVWVAPPSDETLAASPMDFPTCVAGANAAMPIIEFLPVGQPISAEQRGSYRVSVAACDFYAVVAKHVKCQVVDVSPEGVAVLCDHLTIGQRVNVSFERGGIRLEGQMTVQTCKETRSGRLRFGLHAPDLKAPIRSKLQKLTMLMQREQLKRLAGAA
jgi:PilZ domain